MLPISLLDNDLSISWKSPVYCPNCYKAFSCYTKNSTRRTRPFVLECSHSICESCVNQGIQLNLIKCDICKFTVTINRNGTKSEYCQINYYLSGILQYVNYNLQSDLEFIRKKKNINKKYLTGGGGATGGGASGGGGGGGGDGGDLATVITKKNPPQSKQNPSSSSAGASMQLYASSTMLSTSSSSSTTSSALASAHKTLFSLLKKSNEYADKQEPNIIKSEELCFECNIKPFEYYCYQCKTSYCKECSTKVHSMAKIFQSHTIKKFDINKSIKSSAININSGIEKRLQILCDLHDHKLLEYHCHTCNKPICSLCRQKHLKHTIKKMEMLENSQSINNNNNNININQTKQNIMDAVKQCNESQSEIKGGIYHLERFVLQTIDQISQKFIDCHSKLQVLEQQLLKTLKMDHQMLLQKIESIDLLIESNQTKFEEILNSLNSQEILKSHNINRLLMVIDSFVRETPSSITFKNINENPYQFRVHSEVPSLIFDQMFAINYNDEHFNGNAKTIYGKDINLPGNISTTKSTTSIQPEPLVFGNLCKQNWTDYRQNGNKNQNVMNVDNKNVYVTSSKTAVALPSSVVSTTTTTTTTVSSAAFTATSATVSTASSTGRSSLTTATYMDRLNKMQEKELSDCIRGKCLNSLHLNLYKKWFNIDNPHHHHHHHTLSHQQYPQHQHPQHQPSFASKIDTQIVKVSYIKNPQHFYIQHNYFLMNSTSFGQILANMAIDCEIPKEFVINRVYLIEKYETDGSKLWYRGKLLARLTNINNDTYKVFFIDYGNELIVNGKNFRELTDELLSERPGEAHLCSIYGIKPIGTDKQWTNSSTFLMAEILTNCNTVSMLICNQNNDDYLPMGLSFEDDEYNNQELEDENQDDLEEIKNGNETDDRDPDDDDKKNNNFDQKNQIKISKNKKKKLTSSSMEVLSSSTESLDNNNVPIHDDDDDDDDGNGVTANDRLHVDLITNHFQYPVSLRDVLLFTNCALPKKSRLDKTKWNAATQLEEFKEKIMTTEYKAFHKSIWKAGETFNVKILNVISPSEFFVVKTDYEHRIQKQQEELNRFYVKSKSERIYLPRANMICAVNLNFNWYRARIITVLKTVMCTIWLVDVGTLKTVSWEQLRVLDERFRVLSEGVHICSMCDIQPLATNKYEWTDMAIGDFKHLSKYPEIKMTIIKYMDKCYEVVLYLVKSDYNICVNALLVQNEDATSTGDHSVKVKHIKRIHLQDMIDYDSPMIEKDNSTLVNLQINDVIGAAAMKNNKGIGGEHLINAVGKTTTTTESNTIIDITNFTPIRTKVNVLNIISPGEFYVRILKYEKAIEKVHSMIQDLMDAYWKPTTAAVKELSKQCDIMEQQSRTITEINTSAATGAGSSASSSSMAMAMPIKILQRNSTANFNESTATTTTTIWQPNDYCLAYVKLPNKSSLKKLWYRAKIIQICPDDQKMIRIFLRDHGIEMQIEKFNLAAHDKYLQYLCDGAVRCHMACVKPTGDSKTWQLTAIDHFRAAIPKFEYIAVAMQGPKRENSHSVIVWGMTSECTNALSPTKIRWVNINKVLVHNGVVHLYEKFLAIKQTQPLDNEEKQIEYELDNIEKTIYKLRVDQDLMISTSGAVTDVDGGDAGDDDDDAGAVNDNDNTIMLNITSSDESINNNNNNINISTIDDKNENNTMLQNDDNFKIEINHWLPPDPNDKLIFNGVPTYVDMDCIVYIRDSSKDDVLEQLKESINKRFKNSIADKNYIWKCNDICFARYHLDNCFYRAQIVDIDLVDSTNVLVQFVDYGNQEECTLNDLRKVDKFHLIPIIVNRYCLANISPPPLPSSSSSSSPSPSTNTKWPRSILDYIHAQIVEKLCSIRIVKDDSTSTLDLEINQRKNIVNKRSIINIESCLIKIGDIDLRTILLKEMSSHEKLNNIKTINQATSPQSTQIPTKGFNSRNRNNFPGCGGQNKKYSRNKYNKKLNNKMKPLMNEDVTMATTISTSNIINISDLDLSTGGGDGDDDHHHHHHHHHHPEEEEVEEEDFTNLFDSIINRNLVKHQLINDRLKTTHDNKNRKLLLDRRQSSKRPQQSQSQSQSQSQPPPQQPPPTVAAAAAAASAAAAQQNQTSNCDRNVTMEYDFNHTLMVYTQEFYCTSDDDDHDDDYDDDDEYDYDNDVDHLNGISYDYGDNNDNYGIKFNKNELNLSTALSFTPFETSTQIMDIEERFDINNKNNNNNNNHLPSSSSSSVLGRNFRNKKNPSSSSLTIDIGDGAIKTNTNTMTQQIIKKKSHSNPLDDFPKMKLPALNRFYGEIVCIKNPLEMYVTPDLEDYSRQFNDMMLNIQRTVKTLKPISDIDVNMKCLAMYKEDGLWYRAIVQDYDKALDIVTVQYCDYLNTATIHLNDIRRLPLMLLDIPLRVIELRLYGLKTNLYLRDMDISRKLADLVNNRTIFIEIIRLSGNDFKIPEVNLYENGTVDCLLYDKLIQDRYYINTIK